MKKFLYGIAISTALMVGFSVPASAQLKIDFPLWQLYVGTSGNTNSSSSFAYTNVFCTSDVNDAVTLKFSSTTGAMFYATSHSWSKGGSWGYLGSTDTTLRTKVSAIRDVSSSNELYGKAYQYGNLQVVFANSSRGNLDISYASYGTVTLSTNGKFRAGGFDIISSGSGLTASASNRTELTKGSNAGCFVDVILPVLSNASFSIPAVQATGQLGYNGR